MSMNLLRAALTRIAADAQPPLMSMKMTVEHAAATDDCKTRFLNEHFGCMSFLKQQLYCPN